VNTRSAANGHGDSTSHGSTTNGGPSGPYALTICGIPLNQAAGGRWEDMVFIWP
jgi:hypothetical protein